MVRSQQEEQSETEQESEKEEKQLRRVKVDGIDKFKVSKRITMNVACTQYEVVSEVGEALGWRIQRGQTGDWDVLWQDLALHPALLIRMHLFQRVNHLPAIQGLARKNLLAANLSRMQSKFPQEYCFFPATWLLPHQYAAFRTFFESKPIGKTRTFIAKPQADCQGRGIFLTRNISDLENGKHYVVQRYVARPFLLDGLKFDLRIYALLCGTDPLRLYLYKQGLGRLATQPYIPPTSRNLQNYFMHLTNYAINKLSPKFLFNNASAGHKRTLSTVYKQLAAKGVNVERLKSKINDIIVKTVLSGLPLMAHQYRCSQPQDYSGSVCFHILGFDVMLNSAGDPILLEVNHTPSFTTDTPLDHQVKFNLIKDALVLLNITHDTRSELLTRAKAYNSERLMTGKRHIFDGEEREALLSQAQIGRDEYENAHLGAFEKIYPCEDRERMDVYKKISIHAQKCMFQESGSLRIKKMEEDNWRRGDNQGGNSKRGVENGDNRRGENGDKNKGVENGDNRRVENNRESQCIEDQDQEEGNLCSYQGEESKEQTGEESKVKEQEKMEKNILYESSYMEKKIIMESDMSKSQNEFDQLRATYDGVVTVTQPQMQKMEEFGINSQLFCSNNETATNLFRKYQKQGIVQNLINKEQSSPSNRKKNIRSVKKVQALQVTENIQERKMVNADLPCISVRQIQTLPELVLKKGGQSIIVKPLPNIVQSSQNSFQKNKNNVQQKRNLRSEPKAKPQKSCIINQDLKDIFCKKEAIYRKRNHNSKWQKTPYERHFQQRMKHLSRGRELKAKRQKIQDKRGQFVMPKIFCLNFQLQKAMFQKTKLISSQNQIFIGS